MCQARQTQIQTNAGLEMLDDTVHVGFPRSAQNTWALTLEGVVLKALLHTLLLSSELYQGQLEGLHVLSTRTEWVKG